MVAAAIISLSRVCQLLPPRFSLLKKVTGCAKLSTTAALRHDNAKVNTELVLTKNMLEDGSARVLTLNNPPKRNALSLDMLRALENCILHSDIRTKVIIIRSNGSVFSAGHDLKELRTERGLQYRREVFDKCTEVMKLVQDIPMPVIAEVNGLATAAGCQLVASCDIAVASEQARFATPGVHVGLFCSTPAVAVGRAVPKKIAMEMLFTGEPISAQEALLYGLISRVVPSEKLEDTTLIIAEKIAKKSKFVVALGKQCFYSQMEKSRDEAYKEATEAMLNNLMLADCQEGITAFVDKRKPVWKHTDDKITLDKD